MNNYQTFLKLHCNPYPFLLGNIWDVNSAKIFAANGYQAIGTSSHAIAAANGYEDGEQIPFDIIVRTAQRITQAVGIPLTVDIEAGYSRTEEGIINNIEKLHAAGVTGINIEDTVPGTKRGLTATAVFAETVAAIADHIRRKNLQVFLNVRTDAFLLGMQTAPEETVARVKAYGKAGANGIFVPGIIVKKDISEIVHSTLLPVNVMCIPGLPDFDVLGSLGVKRISMGGFFYNKVYEGVQQLSKAVLDGNNFLSIIHQ